MALASCACKCSSLAKGEKLPLLGDAEVERLLGEICPTWKVKERENDGIKFLARSFVAKNFKAAIKAIADYGEAAEAAGAGHHPDMHLTNYRTVTVEYHTFSSGGLTKDDFIMAAKLDRISVVYSPKFVRENPKMTAGLRND
jgi:4a-hydroxytetrahydrobiopterin dehydratase